MDDIVTRLRAATPYGLEDHTVLADAADEVEQLRGRVSQQRTGKMLLLLEVEQALTERVIAAGRGLEEAVRSGRGVDEALDRWAEALVGVSADRNPRLGLDSWVEVGVEMGWVSSPYCETHDGSPLSEAEMTEFDEGGDPCIVALRLLDPEEG
jgi:hypothetical protein